MSYIGRSDVEYDKTSYKNNNTPAMNATNLNNNEEATYRHDYEILELDDALSGMITQMVKKADLQSAIVDMRYESGTGRIYVSTFSGQKNILIGQIPIQKIPTDFGVDGNANIYLTTRDGTKWTASLKGYLPKTKIFTTTDIIAASGNGTVINKSEIDISHLHAYSDYGGSAIGKHTLLYTATLIAPSSSDSMPVGTYVFQDNLNGIPSDSYEYDVDVYKVISWGDAFTSDYTFTLLGQEETVNKLYKTPYSIYSNRYLTSIDYSDMTMRFWITVKVNEGAWVRVLAKERDTGKILFDRKLTESVTKELITTTLVGKKEYYNLYYECNEKQWSSQAILYVLPLNASEFGVVAQDIGRMYRTTSGTEVYTDAAARTAYYKIKDEINPSYYLYVRDNSITKNKLDMNLYNQFSKQAEIAEDYAKLSHSWAQVLEGESVYPNRTDEAKNNSYYWAERAKYFAEKVEGKLTYCGSIYFKDIPTKDSEPGLMIGDYYDIIDAFITDERFDVGPGVEIPEHTNIAWTKDGVWDTRGKELIYNINGEKGEVYTKTFYGVKILDTSTDLNTILDFGEYMITPKTTIENQPKWIDSFNQYPIRLTVEYDYERNTYRHVIQTITTGFYNTTFKRIYDYDTSLWGDWVRNITDDDTFAGVTPVEGADPGLVPSSGPTDTYLWFNNRGEWTKIDYIFDTYLDAEHAINSGKIPEESTIYVQNEGNSQSGEAYISEKNVYIKDDWNLVSEFDGPENNKVSVGSQIYLEGNEEAGYSTHIEVSKDDSGYSTSNYFQVKVYDTDSLTTKWYSPILPKPGQGKSMDAGDIDEHEWVDDIHALRIKFSLGDPNNATVDACKLTVTCMAGFNELTPIIIGISGSVYADTTKPTVLSLRTVLSELAQRLDGVQNGYVRAGLILGNIPGDCSTSEGEMTRAIGSRSHAEGYWTYTNANAGHAEGYYTNAFGNYTHAEGWETDAASYASHAEGYSTVASGRYSHSEGHNNEVTSDSGHVEGYGNRVTGEYAHAEGNDTTASGTASHAEGNESKATASYAHAEGLSTQATNIACHAEGYNTIASGSDYGSHAEGFNNTASGAYSHAEGGNNTATALASHVEGFQNTSGGAGSHVEGSNNSTSGNQSHVEGYNNTLDATYMYSHVEGYNHTINGVGDRIYGIHIEGFQNKTQATVKDDGTKVFPLCAHLEGAKNLVGADAAHAEGIETSSTGYGSHSEGDARYYYDEDNEKTVYMYTEATGDGSHAEGMGSLASGHGSHAEGYAGIRVYDDDRYHKLRPTASGLGSHAEGEGTLASGNWSHAEGIAWALRGQDKLSTLSTASGQASHTEGAACQATALVAHAEGFNTTASGQYSHSEGYKTSASGLESHAEGRQTTASADHSHAEGDQTKASANAAHAEGYLTTASGAESHAEGNSTTAGGDNSHAEGDGTVASGLNSHVEGLSNTASAPQAHAEGYNNNATKNNDHVEGSSNTASGGSSHAEGAYTKATEICSHAEGQTTEANGYASHAGGEQSYANRLASFAHGYLTTATYNDYQAVFGVANVLATSSKPAYFIVGNGTSNTTRSNAFRVSTTGGVYNSSGTYSSGADYAEMFEWSDGNQNQEDRVGRFVELVGEKIQLTDDITKAIGIVSGKPSVCGDTYDDQWRQMYLSDIYGRPIMEEVEEEFEELDSDGNLVKVKKTITRQKLNPDYDSTKEYVPRSERPEWDCIGLLGKLVVIDDGTAEVGSYVVPMKGGIATKANKETKFRVLSRLDTNHIRVLILR